MGKQSENAALINDFITKGQIVPVKITVTLIKNAMVERGWEVGCGLTKKCKYLVDGFPRNADNVKGWEETIGDEASVRGVVYIKCSEETMTQRILKRSESSGRSDDNLEVIKKRFDTYNSETFPTIERLKNEGTPIFELDGEKDPETVYSQCHTLIKSLL